WRRTRNGSIAGTLTVDMRNNGRASAAVPLESRRSNATLAQRGRFVAMRRAVAARFPIRRFTSTRRRCRPLVPLGPWLAPPQTDAPSPVTVNRKHAFWEGYRDGAA